VIATGVAVAAVSPDGRRIAYTQPRDDGTTQIWGYDVGLRSHYMLGNEKGVVSSMSWAPAGNRLAYLLVGTPSSSLRVLGVAGSGSITTVATGDLTNPLWLRDSGHVVVGARVPSPAGPIRKAFLLNVAAPPPSLTLATGLPADPTIEVTDPVPSPDGHQIAFISANQVWLMNADGTRPTPLTRSDPGSFPYSCLMPAWTRS
jgi:Tol biopolymer transport system component